MNKIIYNKNSLDFSPETEFLDKKLIPHMETPYRLKAILKEVGEVIPGDGILLDPKEVHSKEMVERIKSSVNYTQEVLFNMDTKDQFCTDTYTPFNKDLMTTLNASNKTISRSIQEYLSGSNVYALTRPPGHHSGINTFGGYCYFNFIAMAANKLSKNGKVAILDLDFHHGNGTEEIFYTRADVLTLSIHGDPDNNFPNSGYEDDCGRENGLGFNQNYIVSEDVNIKEYIKVLKKAINKINKYDPDYILIAFGTDTFKDDPIAGFNLGIKDYSMIGKELKNLKKDLLIVQEGGYDVDNIGKIVKTFLKSLK